MNQLVPILYVCMYSISTATGCGPDNFNDKIVMEPVPLPVTCMMAGLQKEAEYSQKHPGMMLDFRVTCDRPNRQGI